MHTPTTLHSPTILSDSELLACYEFQADWSYRLGIAMDDATPDTLRRLYGMYAIVTADARDLQDEIGRRGLTS